MDAEFWKLFFTAGGGLAGLFALIRYHIGSMNTMQQKILGHTEAQQRAFLAHLEVKNGHNERIAKEFSETNRLVADRLQQLATEVAKRSSIHG